MKLQILAFASIALITARSATAQTNDRIFYSSLNKAVQLGQMDGVTSVKELKKHGNFGVGSQHGLAGELVLLDGKAYKITVDGKASMMPDTATLPFAATKLFRAEQKLTITRAFTLEQLQQHLDSVLNTNRFAAIKVTGTFSALTYKVYYPQQKPYPAIKETSARIFDSTHIAGTMVGFFTPKSALVLNSPNYHFHFINAGRTSGGHVDNCTAERVTVEIDYADGLEVKLPQPASLYNIDLNKP